MGEFLEESGNSPVFLGQFRALRGCLAGTHLPENLFVGKSAHVFGDVDID